MSNKEGEIITEEEEKKNSEWVVSGENSAPKGQPVEIHYAPSKEKQFVGLPSVDNQAL